jgi:quinol monooxygenase YgiN
MTSVFIHHRVSDYNAWRPEFDKAVKADWATGIRSYRVWRGTDDPNLLIVVNTFDSRQAAETAMNNPALREAMGRGGVIPSSCRSTSLMKSPPGRSDQAAGSANTFPLTTRRAARDSGAPVVIRPA